MRRGGGENSKPPTPFDYKSLYTPKLGWCTDQVTIDRRTKVSFFRLYIYEFSIHVDQVCDEILLRLAASSFVAFEEKTVNIVQLFKILEGREGTKTPVEAVARSDSGKAFRYRWFFFVCS